MLWENKWKKGQSQTNKKAPCEERFKIQVLHVLTDINYKNSDFVFKDFFFFQHFQWTFTSFNPEQKVAYKQADKETSVSWRSLVRTDAMLALGVGPQARDEIWLVHWSALPATHLSFTFTWEGWRWMLFHLQTLVAFMSQMRKSSMNQDFFCF